MNFTEDFRRKGPISQIVKKISDLERAVREIRAILNQIPHMTTVERNAIATPLAGMLIYNTTTNKLNLYTTGWEEITSV